jgi:hypothetical protein
MYISEYLVEEEALSPIYFQQWDIYLAGMTEYYCLEAVSEVAMEDMIQSAVESTYQAATTTSVGSMLPEAAEQLLTLYPNVIDPVVLAA